MGEFWGSFGGVGGVSEEFLRSFGVFWGSSDGFFNDVRGSSVCTLRENVKISGGVCS